MDLGSRSPIRLRLGIFVAVIAVAFGLTVGSAQAAVPPPTVTWTGIVDTNWFNPLNWSTGVAPGAADDVLIPAAPGNQPVLAGATTVRTLEVQTGATLQMGLASTTTTLTVINDAGGTFTPLENAGTIVMQSTISRAVSIAVTSGTLLNTGTINMNANGNRTIAANLDNQGTININANAGGTAFFNLSGATYANTGTITIASGEFLTVDGSTETFNQNGGVLDVDGTFNVTGSTFNFNGGTISGTDGTGIIRLSNSTLDLATASPAVTFRITGTSSKLLGNVSANQTLQLVLSQLGLGSYLRT